jgi:tripartite ATP-independent transporter DctP family solute receptor
MSADLVRERPVMLTSGNALESGLRIQSLHTPGENILTMPKHQHRKNTAGGCAGFLGRLTFTALVVLVIAGCSSDLAPPDDTIVLRAAHSTNVDEPYHQGLLEMARIVREKSDGRVEIAIYPSMQLGGEKAMLEGLLLGAIDIVVTANGSVTNFVPGMGVLDLPFLFRSRDHMYTVLDGEVGNELADRLEARGFHLLAFYEAGVRHIMTADRPVHSIDDIRGLKMRTMPVPAHIASFNAYGANAVAVDYSELYGGLQTGLVDGAEAANTNYSNKKFYEVAPYWAQLGWVMLTADLLMSDERFRSLPVDVQTILKEAALESAHYERRLYAQSDNSLLDSLEQQGVSVTYPDPAPFREASKAVYDEFVTSAEDRALLEAILQ